MRAMGLGDMVWGSRVTVCGYVCRFGEWVWYLGLSMFVDSIVMVECI